MDITIIGAGNIASGNDVTLAARDESEAAELAPQLRAAAKSDATVTAAPFGGPIAGDIVVLAVPYSSVPSIIRQYGDELTDKIVVDITNPTGQVAGQPLDVFIAGGLRPIDVGPLRRARQLEGVGLLHIALQGTLGTKGMSALKVLG
jgi:predicted dinucleotide-binding enzyme